jgi:hypothetical protein
MLNDALKQAEIENSLHVSADETRPDDVHDPVLEQTIIVTLGLRKF